MTLERASVHEDVLECGDRPNTTKKLARNPETSNRCREWAEQWSLDRVGALTESVLMEMADAGSPATAAPLVDVNAR